jgi:hypothetical protein
MRSYSLHVIAADSSGYPPIPVAARSKALALGHSLAVIEGSNTAGKWVCATCECFVLSGRSLCDWPLPRLEESYRALCI